MSQPTPCRRPNPRLLEPHIDKLTSKYTVPTYKKIPVRKPGPDEVLVAIKYSGVCHTDVHCMKGDWPLKAKLPVVGGHEGAGIVVAKGDAVTTLEIGDRTGIKWINSTCGTCEFCTSGIEQLCGAAKLSGCTADGSFQQYAIAQASVAVKIPDSVDLAAVSPVMCAGLTVYKALKETGAQPGQRVAIVGAAGGLGAFGLQYARAMGLVPIAVDVGADKEKDCLALGADVYVDVQNCGPGKGVTTALRAATPDGLGPHAAVLVASEAEPFVHASDYCRPKGTVVIVGIPGGEDAEVKSNVWDVCARDITLKGSLVGSRADLAEALDLFARGLIKVPIQIVSLSELHRTLDLLHHNLIKGRHIVDVSK